MYTVESFRKFPNFKEITDEFGYSRNIEETINYLASLELPFRADDIAPTEDGILSVWVDGIAIPAIWFNWK